MSKPTIPQHIIDSHTQRLTHYMTIAQMSIFHVANQLNRDEAKIQIYHTQAVQQWSNHPLYSVPFLQAPERVQWFEKIDSLCSQIPPPNDHIAWIVRVFASYGAVEAITMHEFTDLSMDDEALINVEVNKRMYKNIVGHDRPSTGSQTPRDEEAAAKGANYELIGRVVERPTNRRSRKPERLMIVDYVSGLSGRAFFLLQNVASGEDGETETITQRELEKLRMLPEDYEPGQ